MSKLILQAVGQGGVARAEFSADVTFSLFFNECLFIFAIVVVFIRNKYSIAGQNTRGFGRFWCTKWCFRLKAILFQTVHSANSVRFLLSRKFSPRVPPEPLRVPLGVRVPQFGNRWPSTTRAGASLSTFKKLLKTQLFREHFLTNWLALQQLRSCTSFSFLGRFSISYVK